MKYFIFILIVYTATNATISEAANNDSKVVSEDRIQRAVVYNPEITESEMSADVGLLIRRKIRSDKRDAAAVAK